MNYEDVVILTAPGEKEPEANHSDTHYCHKVRGKPEKKGKQKIVPYVLTYVPWGDINKAELLALATHGLSFGSSEEMERWRVLSHGLSRREIIEIIRGKADLKNMSSNPTHIARDRLSKLMCNNWKYIYAQVSCNTLCWECPDAKALECVLENDDMLKGEDI